jgi:hypothetical protein
MRVVLLETEHDILILVPRVRQGRRARLRPIPRCRPVDRLHARAVAVGLVAVRDVSGPVREKEEIKAVA